MANQAAAASSHVPRSFAGVLSDAVVPEKGFPPARDLEGLEDDVVSVSYEHALSSRGYASFGKQRGWSVASRPETAAGTDRDSAAGRTNQPRVDSVPAAESLSRSSTRKSASVTVRLSQDESERLHQRAEEAGMTVSAYLRSCAFEVEALRAEVKATLSRLRSESATPSPAAAAPGTTSHGSYWLHSLLRRLTGRNSR